MTTKKEMLTKIYEVMDWDRKIIRFGNILSYIDLNLFWVEDKEFGVKSRNIVRLNQCLHTLYYLFLGKHEEPIDNQNPECIKYVYDLVRKGG